MHTHTHTHTHTGPGTSRGLGKGKGPTTKAMGLRLPPPGAPAWVLALSVAPEAAKPLHGELGAPWEPGQVCMPGLAGGSVSPGWPGARRGAAWAGRRGAQELRDAARARWPQPGVPQPMPEGSPAGPAAAGQAGWSSLLHPPTGATAKPEQPLPLSRQEAAPEAQTGLFI